MLCWIILAALSARIVAQTAGPCRFKNGTALPTGDFYDWYQPCPGSSICCALNRNNPPGGNVSVGFTRDECLPNGLCQNRATERKVATQWWVNYCTEADWHGGKCMDICPAGITEVMSCDGTATSERWCCGTSTDCCSTNVGVVTLKQVFASKSPSSSTSTVIHPQTSSSATPSGGIPGTRGSEPTLHRNDAAIIVGAVLAASVGVAVLLVGFRIARQRSRRRLAERKVMARSRPVEACAMSQRHELDSVAEKAVLQELPGTQPGGLPVYSTQAWSHAR